MSGDKREKNKLNPGIEFFYKLSFNKKFQQDLVKARKQLGIEELGYKKTEDRRSWINRNENTFDLLGIQLHFRKKYKVPEAYWWEFIDDYIFFGKPLQTLNKKIQVAVIDLDGHKYKKNLFNPEEFYRENNEPYVKMYILGNADKTSVTDFINKNWKNIEDTLDIQRGSKKVKIRKTRYKERNLLISELYRKPIKELRQQANDKLGKYKDSLIKKILQKEGHGIVSDGYIRKICNQK